MASPRNPLVCLPAAALVLIPFLTPGAAHADVVDAVDAGFHIRIETRIAATPEQTYRQFVRVQDWWDGDHSWFGDASGFSLEPRAGGCFCEVSGERSVMHMQVSYVDPGKEVRLIGGLGPLQPMGLHGAMSFKFEPDGVGATRVVHEYRVTGYAPDGLTELAKAVDAVQSHQVSRLKARLEND